jgi:hypothetical protein
MDIWSDSDTLMTPSTSSASAEQPPPGRPSPLTQRQNDLLVAYLYHKERVDDMMNTVVDLQIKLARERDLPEKYLVEPKEKLTLAEEDLIHHRDLKRRKEAEIVAEEARLSKIGTLEAKTQLEEIGWYMGRGRRGMTLIR